MRPLIAALTVIWLAAVSTAAAQEACDVPGNLLFSESALNHVTAAVKNNRQLNVVVFGTGSSALAGPDGVASAYPARLQVALTQRLPGVAVSVVSLAKMGQTAADMTKDIDKIIVDLKPNLVVWQTGTVDAMRGVEPDQFRAVLDSGVDKLHDKGSDVILMNMQYSPRTELVIALSVYADNMREIARENEVPLFDRLAIMHYWNDTGAFDLYAGSKNSKTAQRVHDCIGRAVAAMVIDAAHLNDAATRTPK
ncbi:MAG: SGNH/GDSL hydrolase family protein [Rhizobiales bacterium]|nr:SGNH/GDSL hydrolase family protein [Hyphomicrobiales bacterium]